MLVIQLGFSAAVCQHAGRGLSASQLGLPSLELSRQSGYFLDIFQKHTCSAGEESFMDVLLHLLIWSTLAFLCEPLLSQDRGKFQCRINGTQNHRDAQGKGTVGGYRPMLCSQLSAGISSSVGGGVGTQMDGRLLLITSPCRSSG